MKKHIPPTPSQDSQVEEKTEPLFSWAFTSVKELKQPFQEHRTKLGVKTQNKYVEINITYILNLKVTFLKDAFFFPLYNFHFFVKNGMFIGVWINIQVFNSIPFVNVSVFMPIPSCFHYCSYVLELYVRDGNASGQKVLA